jgi:PAS domain S-box-containing protein/putative nucleotidyltransferase with HDIG domain
MLDVVTDITQRRQAEEALAASESRLKTIFEHAPSGIMLGDSLTGRMNDANPMAAKIAGRTIEEMCELDWMSITHPDDLQADLDNMARMNAGETNGFQMEKRFVRPDGSTVWVSMTVAPVPLGDEMHPRHVAMLVDITADKAAEELAVRQKKRIERTLTSVIDIAGAIGELRDPYTAGHQKRVAELAARIAQELGMSDLEVADIRVAALLHDIGKAAVPTELLGKPGLISPVELDLIKGHAEAGYRIAVSANLEEPIPELIHQHHERCDGSGYPRGLVGDQILSGAKVLAVADVVEAIVSHRPYRPALGIDAALAEIERGAGRLYDAEVSRVCVALFRGGHFEFSS